MSAPAATDAPPATGVPATPPPATVNPANAPYPTVTPPATTTQPPAAAPSDNGQIDEKKSLADLIKSLPDEAQKIVLGEVNKARDEAKNLRTRLKEADPAKAKQDLLGELAKAAGIGAEAAPDPTALAAKLTEQTNAALDAQRQLTVHRLATAAGADANKLLDSVSFSKTLAALDTSDDAVVSEAIKNAVAANATLAPASTSRLPASNPAAGSSAAGAPDLESLIAEAQKRGDHRTVISLQNQKMRGSAATGSQPPQ